MKRILGWVGIAFHGIFIAGLFAAASFWVHGLTFDQAKILAAIVFPIVLCLYVIAIWRGYRRDNLS